MKIPLNPRYGLLAVAYVLAIHRLSSIPDLPPEPDSVVRLAFNLGHVPLFAGLAFCLLQSLPGLGRAWGTRYGLAFALSAACGALDEWHQSFVPGRDCSLGDFLLDLAGIAGMLVALRLIALRNQRRPGDGARFAPGRPGLPVANTR